LLITLVIIDSIADVNRQSPICNPIASRQSSIPIFNLHSAIGNVMAESNRSIVIGTAGHIDHGKSTLVRALTGTDPDRLKEEKARGITIDLGFAHTQIGDFNVAFVDVPGHERFVKNMLAGVGGIDAVLLVIAADESVMPQTREHFAARRWRRPRSLPFRRRVVQDSTSCAPRCSGSPPRCRSGPVRASRDFRSIGCSPCGDSARS
jgi:hypothetical protein